MAKGDGVLFVVLGLIATIASLFFPFYSTGVIKFQGSEHLAYVFQNFGDYMSLLENIVDLFDASVWIGILMLYAIIFLVALLIILVGLNSSSSQLGGYLLLIHPIAYLILNVLLPGANGGDFSALFNTIKFGCIFQIIGALFVIIGAMRNKSHY